MVEEERSKLSITVTVKKKTRTPGVFVEEQETTTDPLVVSMQQSDAKTYFSTFLDSLMQKSFAKACKGDDAACMEAKAVADDMQAVATWAASSGMDGANNDSIVKLSLALAVVFQCAASEDHVMEAPSPSQVIEARAHIDHMATRKAASSAACRGLMRYPHLKQVLASAKRRCAAGRSDACATEEFETELAIIEERFNIEDFEGWCKSIGDSGCAIGKKILNFTVEATDSVNKLAFTLPMWSPIKLEQLGDKILRAFALLCNAVMAGFSATLGGGGRRHVGGGRLAGAHHRIQRTRSSCRSATIGRGARPPSTIRQCRCGRAWRR